MEAIATLICAADAVPESGVGVRFALRAGNEDASGFVVRFQGRVYAYLNRCAHVPIELDWEEGQFFESGKRFIMCSTHGAIYTPETGQCAGGPCRGGRLRQITVQEREQQIYWLSDEYFQPPAKSTIIEPTIESKLLP